MLGFSSELQPSSGVWKLSRIKWESSNFQVCLEFTFILLHFHFSVLYIFSLQMYRYCDVHQFRKTFRIQSEYLWSGLYSWRHISRLLIACNCVFFYIMRTQNYYFLFWFDGATIPAYNSNSDIYTSFWWLTLIFLGH